MRPLSLMFDKLLCFDRKKVFHCKVDSDNYPSQGINEKLGAMPNRVKLKFFCMKTLEKFAKDNLNLIEIDDN